jgi:hypothetical protein
MYLRVYGCTYVRMHVCKYVCTYVIMYACIYGHIHLSTNTQETNVHIHAWKLVSSPLGKHANMDIDIDEGGRSSAC